MILIKEQQNQQSDNPSYFSSWEKIALKKPQTWTEYKEKGTQTSNKQTMKLKYVILKAAPGLFLCFYFNALSVTPPLT